MKLSVLNNHQDIAIDTAQEIYDAIQKKNKEREYFVLGLATGSTMEPVYTELVRMHKEQDLDFSQVKFFNLDNYIGLSKSDRNNYEEQLYQLFLKKINAHPDNINLVSSAQDFDHAAYEEEIKNAGGIDIQLLGIGRNGHIGFNEVGSNISSPTRKIKLSKETIEDNGKFFNQIDSETSQTETIPLTAHTRGISPILKAKRIICLASGHAKAQAVRKIFLKGTIEELPVRALIQHPKEKTFVNKVKILVDVDALALFNEDDLMEHTDLTKSQRKKVIKAHQFYLVSLKIKEVNHKVLLPQMFDFYNPRTMSINESFNPNNQDHLSDLATCLNAAECISVGAHPDDAEIMAGPMMLKATKPWLTLILTNGAATNNTLNGEYAQFTPEQLTQMRQIEQRQAATYAGVPLIMCKFPTAAIIGDMGENTLLKARRTMSGLFNAMKNLKIVYGHNPLDEHDTHINTFAEQVEALRTLSDEKLKEIKIWGMEVWGILHVAKQRLLKIPIENKELLSRWRTLISFYQSQIAGQGRDYSEATIDRAFGNAGYQTHPHGGNPSPGLLLAADLTDLVQKRSLSINDMVRELMSELNKQVINRTERIINDKNSSNKKAEVTSNLSNSFFSAPKEEKDEQETLGGMSFCTIS